MECYEGAKMIKTFRGLIKKDTEITIPLATSNGSTGYIITKLEVLGVSENQDYEGTLQIWKTSQAGAH